MSTTHILLGSLTTIYTTAYTPVGTTYFKRGSNGSSGYVFVKNAGADTLAAGDVVSIYDSSGHTYGSVSTTDATEPAFSDATTSRPLVAGIALSAPAVNEFAWLWFFGYGTHTITTDGNVAAFNGLVTADDGKVALPNTTAATAHWMQWGLSLAADVSTSLTAATLGGPGMFPWSFQN